MSSGDDPGYYGQPMPDPGDASGANTHDIDAMIDAILTERDEAWRQLAEL